MLDAAVFMGAVAQLTKRIRLGTSVLISPYRHPLSDARQFMTVDQLSNGRLMLGVGAGWMKEEFDSVGIEHSERNERLVECIEIYKRAWTQSDVSFPGDFYNFSDLGDGKYGFGVADVSGKGIKSSLLMSKASSLYRCLSKTIFSAAELLKILNDEICETASRGMFVTMVIGFFDSNKKYLILATLLPALLVNKIFNII